MFTIEPLYKSHDRSRFDCGYEALNRYIRQQASQDERRNVTRVFVARLEGNSEIAGFYTLSAGSVERDALPEKNMKRLPRYPVPVALLGRLAIDRRWSGQGLGAMLLANALQRVRQASSALAVYAVVVDAKDEQAQTFYEHFGFIRLPGAKRRLFYPVAGIT